MMFIVIGKEPQSKQYLIYSDEAFIQLTLVMHEEQYTSICIQTNGCSHSKINYVCMVNMIAQCWHKQHNMQQQHTVRMKEVSYNVLHTCQQHNAHTVRGRHKHAEQTEATVILLQKSCSQQLTSILLRIIIQQLIESKIVKIYAP